MGALERTSFQTLPSEMPRTIQTTAHRSRGHFLCFGFWFVLASHIDEGILRGHQPNPWGRTPLDVCKHPKGPVRLLLIQADPRLPPPVCTPLCVCVFRVFFVRIQVMNPSLPVRYRLYYSKRFAYCTHIHYAILTLVLEGHVWRWADPRRCLRVGLFLTDRCCCWCCCSRTTSTLDVGEWGWCATSNSYYF